MKKKILSALKSVLFLCVGIGIIGVVWYNFDECTKQKFWESLGKANYFWLSLTIIIGTLAHVSRALRWKLILEPFGYAPKNSNLFFAVMNMYFFNLAVPRLGEITRCTTLLQYEKIPFEKSFGTVVAERAVDLLMLGIVFGLTSLLQFQNLDLIVVEIQKFMANGGGQQCGDAVAAAPEVIEEPGFLAKNLKWIILGGGATVFGLLYLLRNHPFFGKLFAKVKGLALGFWQGLKSVAQIKKPGQFVFHTIFIWVMYFLMTYVPFFCLPETANVSLLTPLAVLVFGSVAIAIVPGGIGVFPLIVAAILHLPVFGGIDIGTGMALGWIIWASQTLLVLLLGIFSMIALPIANQKKE